MNVQLGHHNLANDLKAILKPRPSVFDTLGVPTLPTLKRVIILRNNK